MKLGLKGPDCMWSIESFRDDCIICTCNSSRMMNKYKIIKMLFFLWHLDIVLVLVHQVLAGLIHLGDLSNAEQNEGGQ